jgi:hypothetical protein
VEVGEKVSTMVVISSSLKERVQWVRHPEKIQM